MRSLPQSLDKTETWYSRASKTYENFSVEYTAKYKVPVRYSQLVYEKISKKQQTKLSAWKEQTPYNYNGTNENDERKKGFFRSFISHEFYISPTKIQT
jgi:hypothetical protein